MNGTDAAPLNQRLPAGLGEAMLRGIRFRCPRCGEGKLFRRFLKPVAGCTACGQDWSKQQADDFPAYVAIFVTGHLMGPLIIAAIQDFDLSVGMTLAILMPLAIAMMIGLLQPSKGAIIAVQWWFGMHGFTRERRLPETPGGG